MYPVHGPRGFISLRDIWPHNIQTVTISLVNKNSDTLHLLETWVANIKNISGFSRAKKNSDTHDIRGNMLTVGVIIYTEMEVQLRGHRDAK